MLILKRPWTRQPQGEARPNLSNELLKGAALFLPFNGSPVDLITGKVATLGTGASTIVDSMGKALYGSGSATVASIPVDLSGSGKVAISFWLDWPGYANDYDLALEYTADGGSNAGFYIAPNASSGGWEITASGGAAGPICQFTRPAAGLHHYAINIDRQKNGSTPAVEMWVDSVSYGLVSGSGAARTGAFANSTLYILNRNNTSLFGNGSIRNLVVRPGVVMTARQALAEYREPWQLFAPQRRYIPTAAAGGSFTSTGALSAQAATIAGTATHLTLHTATGALEAQAATVSGAAVHPHIATGALTAQAATVAGTATHLTLHTATGALEAQAATVAGAAALTSTGNFTSTGALAAQAATVAGTAVHYTLHTISGALAAQAATVAGTAAHYTLHTATGDLVAGSASISGTAVDESTYVPQVSNPVGGKSRKTRKRRLQVEIDGEVFDVDSPEEAEAVLANVAQEATQTAKLAIERASKAKRRPVRKIVRDAEKALQIPAITVPEKLRSYADQMIGQIRAEYQSALSAIEIAAHMARREREIEEDDEEVLMLL